MTWPVVTLGELSTSGGQYGVGLPSRAWRQGDPRYIRITDIQVDGRLNSDVVAPNGERADWEKSILREGDLLFARSGATVGKTYIHTPSVGPAVYAGYLIRFQLNTDRVLPRYVFHYTKSSNYRKWVASNQRAVAQPNINAKQYALMPVPLPPLEEQRRIAAILDHADALTLMRRACLAQLQTLDQSMLYHSFGDPVSEARHPLCPLEEWVDAKRPITYGILKPGPDIPGGVPYVRVADMKEGGIQTESVRRTTPTIAQEYRRSQLVAGDLLVSIRGHVGRFAFVPTELDGGNITQDSARLAITDPLSAIYVRAVLETPGLQRWLARRTKGAAVTGINLGDLRQAPIPRPPMQLQEKFALAVEAASSNCQLASLQLAQLRENFASLQSRAFSGQL